MSVVTDSAEDLRELYRELILDHARSPRHFGKLDGMTHFAEGINPLCGDKLKLYLKVNEKQVIEDARFEGTGCAISVASASLLTDTVAGMHIDDALDFFSAIVGRLVNGQDKTATQSTAAKSIPDIGKLRALEGVKEFPSRVKCATLAWHAMNSALQQHESTVSTE